MKSALFNERDEASEFLVAPTDISSDADLEKEDQEANTFGQIVKSSSIIGGAQVINMVVGLVRTKLVAILIGPSGVGLLAIYHSITGLIGTLAGMGIQTSGVREVARHHGEGDQVAIAKTVRNLRRVCWFTGLAGMLLMVLLAPWISDLSFGSRDFSWAIGALSVTIMLGNITAGQGAIIQGTRQIGDLARISIWGGIFGTVFSVALYFWLGIDGIVPALIVLAIVSLAISTFYARKIRLDDAIPLWRETWDQSRALLKFGLAIVATNIVATAITYATRLIIIRENGLDGVGIYSAAFALSGMFVSFVLGAMGADFYPRLTAESNSHNRMCQLTNEQTEIGLLFAFPGLLATLVFAPLAIQIFYSSDFGDAAGLLVWFILGCMGRVLSWPLAYCILAKGQGFLFMVMETFYHLLHLLLIYLGLKYLGLNGVGIAFLALYVAYSVGLLLLLRFTIDFRWSKEIWNLLGWMTPLALIVVGSNMILPQLYAYLFGVGAIGFSGVLCIRRLVYRLGRSHRIARWIISMPFGQQLLAGC